MVEMRDSGIEWVGKIPTTWEIIRGKYILKYLQKPVKENDSVITCFRDGMVTLRSNRREEGFTMSDKEIGYQGIDVGDLVVHGMDGFAGAIGISDSRGKASPVLNVLDTEQNKRYIMYYLRSMAYSDVFTALATGIRVRSCDLRWNKLADLPYPVPTPKEQQTIVEYIDIKCAEIDALIEDIQTQIDTLEHYKQSIITEVVTKGLDPDVEMEDSGIEWLGNIPNNWKLTRIKYVLDERKEYSTDGKEEPLSMSQKYGLIPTADMDLIPHEASSLVGNKKVYPNDLVFNKLKAHLGVFSVSTYTGIVSPDYAVYYADDYYTAKFLEYLFKTNKYITEFKKRITGVGQGLSRLYTSDLFSIYCAIPSTLEMKRIVEIINEKNKSIFEVIQKKQQQLEILDQYKKSLIYEYVTGKKEVK